MASATGIPESNPHADGNTNSREDEPLLGGPGDASQPYEKGLEFNLILGTGILAQAGIWILTATIWVDVLKAVPNMLFTAHPLLNSAAILLTTQAILLLQPTHTQEQKRSGAHIHAGLNATSVACLAAALIVIEVNKFAHAGTHFESPHAILGLITYILFFLQAIVGVTQFYTPKLYGSVDNAKAIYKYHRASGYVILLMGFVTVAAATQTAFNKGAIHIELWVVIVTAIIVLIGVGPRIKKKKLGL